MNLELVKVPYRKYELPFERRDGYTFDWCKTMSDPDKTTFYRVLREGVEVARVELDEKVYLERLWRRRAVRGHRSGGTDARSA